jgi:glycosyltransferase involved in cell wall biosynthesis
MERKKTLCFFSAFSRHDDEVLTYRHDKALKAAGWNTIYVVNDDEPETVKEGLKIVSTGNNQRKGYLSRIFVAPFQSYKALKKIDADVYQTWCLENMLVCMMLKWKGKKIVFQLREEHPYLYMQKKNKPLWQRKMVVSILLVLMKFFLRRFDFVLATGDDEGEILKELGVKRYCIQGNFPFVNKNFRLSLEDYLKREDRIIYFGSIYRISCQEYLLKAMEKTGSVKYLLAGKFRGGEAYHNQLKQFPKWRDVEFVNGFNPSELNDLMGRSTMSNVLRDFSKTHYHNGNIGIIKIFESMEAGLPLICSHVPVYRKIWEKYKFGMLVDPTNPDQIAEAINYMAQNKEEAYKMGQEGRRAVIEKYNCEAVSKEYVEIINNL